MFEDIIDFFRPLFLSKNGVFLCTGQGRFLETPLSNRWSENTIRSESLTHRFFEKLDRIGLWEVGENWKKDAKKPQKKRNPILKQFPKLQRPIGFLSKFSMGLFGEVRHCNDHSGTFIMVWNALNTAVLVDSVAQECTPRLSRPTREASSAGGRLFSILILGRSDL